MTRGQSIRSWLRENGYEDIVSLIDEVESVWKAKGKHTRRNWWQVLSGTKNGQPRTIEGRSFPVLAAARERLGLATVDRAIRSPEEKTEAPSVWKTSKWASKKECVDGE